MQVSFVNLSLYAIKKHIAPRVCWLMMLLMLAPMGEHAMGAVLCIEADGTVTIEKARGFSCGSEVEAAKQPTADTIASADKEPASHCGSCIDVVLPGEADEDCASFILARAPTAQVALPVVAVVSSSVRTPDAAVTSVRHHPVDERVSFALTPLRSVMLLI